MDEYERDEIERMYGLLEKELHIYENLEKYGRKEEYVISNIAYILCLDRSWYEIDPPDIEV